MTMKFEIATFAQIKAHVIDQIPLLPQWQAKKCNNTHKWMALKYKTFKGFETISDYSFCDLIKIILNI